MDMILHLQRVVNKYKEVLNNLKSVDLTFNEASILYSINTGKNTKKSIISYLGKDRSQIHRLLIKMVKSGLIKEKSEEYSLTSKGISTYEVLNSLNIQFDEEDMDVLFENITKLDNLLISIDHKTS